MAEFDRTGAKAAGYSDEEIDGYLAKQSQPVVSEPFMDRIDRGVAASPFLKSVVAGAKGAKEGFGDGPIGFAPDSESTMFLQKYGIFGNPETGKPGALLNSAEIGLKGVAGAADIIGRTIRAGVHSVGGVFGQIAKDAGASEASGESLKRDINLMGDMAVLLAVSPEAGLMRVARTPAGIIKQEPLGNFPTHQDFTDTAKAFAGGEYRADVETKLRGLYEQKGWHPAEVFADAQTDPVLRAEILARGDDLPPSLGGKGGAPEPPNAPDLGLRLDAEIIEKYGGYYADSKDPLERALSVATGAGWYEEKAIESAKWAMANGRPDIAAEIAARARRSTNSKNTTPGVPEGHPAYEDIAKDLTDRKAESEQIAEQLEDIVGKRRLPTVPGGGPPGPPREPPKPPGPLSEEGPDAFRRTGTSANVRQAEDDILKKVSVGEGEKGGEGLSADRGYEMFVDKLFPLKRAEEEAASKGLDLAVEDRPYVAARLYSGWAGKAEVALKYEGPFDFHTYKNVGPSLESILEPVKSELRSFRAFAVAARAAELENIKGVKSGIDMAAARTVVDAAPKHYKDTLLKAVDFMNQETAYYRDAGMLSHKGFDAMVEGNKLYVPWFRVFDEEGIGIAPVGQTLQAKQVKKRIEGADTRIIDPLESIIRNTFVMKAMAERNVVGTKLANMLRGADNVAGELKRDGREIIPRVEELPEGATDVIEGLHAHGFVGEVPSSLETMLAHVAKPLAENEIRVFENGVPHVYTVDTDIARAFKNLDSEALGMFERMLAAPARMLRAGSVFLPDFWARHMFRDSFYAMSTYEHGTFTPVDMAKGFAGMVVHDPEFVAWMKGGGGHVSMMSLDRNLMQENLRHLTAETGLMYRSWNVVSHPLQPLQAGTEIALSSSHLGAFKKRFTELQQQAAGPKASPVPGVTGPVQTAAPQLGRLTPETLPAVAQGREMYIRDGLNMKEAMRGFGYDVEDGQFRDLARFDTAEKRQVIDAAWTSRDTSIDNTRIGSKMRAYNAISVFANAKIQDLSKGLVENVTNRPGKFSLYVGAGIVAPTAALWWHNKDDSRYQERPQWEKDMFWIFPTDHWEASKPEDAATRPADQVRINRFGQLEVNNGAIIRMPKPFTLGVLFGSGTERLLEAFYKDNPRAFKGFFHSLTESTVGDMLPSAVVPPLEQAMNRSRFSDQTLIPAAQEKLLPEYQYTPYTSELAKKLGHVVSEFPGMHKLTAPEERGTFGGMAAALSSPMLIENYVRGWGGAVGTYAMQAADAAARKAGFLDDPPKAAGTLADIPFVRAFVVRYPSAGVSSIQNFYDEIGDVKRLHETWAAKAKEGDVAAMDRIQAIGGDRVLVQFDDMKKALQSHTQLINIVNKDPKTPPAEKRQLIDSLYFGMQQIAREGVHMIDDMKKELKP